MKKLSSLLLALCLVLSLCAGALADEGGIAPEDLKIGMVCIGDNNSGYDIAHITGLEAAMEALGVPAENVTYKSRMRRLPTPATTWRRTAARSSSPTPTAIRPTPSRWPASTLRSPSAP